MTQLGFCKSVTGVDPLLTDLESRIYGKSTTTRTLISRCLRYQDHQAILQGARQVQQKGPIRNERYALSLTTVHLLSSGSNNL